MAIVNFSISDKLSKRVDNTIKKKGFTSKAEFFRYAAIYYIDIASANDNDEDVRFDYLTKEMASTASMKCKNRKIPSAAEQLKRL